MSKRTEARHAQPSSMLDELVAETPDLLARLDAPAPAFQEQPKLPISDIAPDRSQPRRYIPQDKLDTLSADVARVGILQPLVVRPAPDWNGYIIVFGERRYRAALQAGLTHVPAIVRSDLSDVDVLDLQWQENAQREDIDDIDKAQHLKRMKELRGLSWTQLAEIVHLSRRHLLRMQQLAEMPARVMQMVREHQITPSHVYQLSRLGDSRMQEDLANETVEQKWSVQKLSHAVQQARSGTQPLVTSMSPPHPWTAFADTLRIYLSQSTQLTNEEVQLLNQITELSTALISAGSAPGDIDVTSNTANL